MKVTDVMGLFLARRENYNVSDIRHLHGDMWHVTMEGKPYTAVVLLKSFDYYEKRYHLAKEAPTLVLCFQHNTALPIYALALREGEFTNPFELVVLQEIRRKHDEHEVSVLVQFILLLQRAC